MPSAAELKAELRALRKDHVKPVSRMRVADIASEIQNLKGKREETPAVAAVPSVSLKKSESAVKSIKEAQSERFPVKPVSEVTAGPGTKGKGKAPKNIVPDAVEKKKSKLAKLLAMMDSDDE
jgi:hypothetical protein